MTRPGRTQFEILMDGMVSLLALRYVEPDEVKTVKKAMAEVDLRTTPLFKAILMDDRVTQARRLILRLGGKKFGPALAEQQDALNSIEELDRLQILLDRLLDSSSWQELLAQ